MVKRILVPLDGSLPATEALTLGQQLAARLDAQLSVLALVKPGNTWEAIRNLVTRQVERSHADAALDIRPLTYSVPQDIANEFDAVDQTLVVMQTWARGRSAGLLSNISEDVLRLVRQPIVVVGPDPGSETGSKHADEDLAGPMIIATDGSSFGDAIVVPAARLASGLGLAVELITVIDSSEVPAGVGVAGEANTLHHLLGPVEAETGRPPNFEVLHGDDPAEAIVEYAQYRRAAMVAMSTHGRSGVSRIVEDSVTMDVVRHGPSPVLLHQPPVT